MIKASPGKHPSYTSSVPGTQKGTLHSASVKPHNCSLAMTYFGQTQTERLSTQYLVSTLQKYQVQGKHRLTEELSEIVGEKRNTTIKCNRGAWTGPWARSTPPPPHWWENWKNSSTYVNSIVSMLISWFSWGSWMKDALESLYWFCNFSVGYYFFNTTLVVSLDLAE